MKLFRTTLPALGLAALFGVVALRSDVQANSPTIQILLVPNAGSLTCTAPAGSTCGIFPTVGIASAEGYLVIPDCCAYDGADGAECEMYAAQAVGLTTVSAYSSDFLGPIEPSVFLQFKAGGTPGSVVTYPVTLSAYCAYWITASFPTGFFYLPKQEVSFNVQIKAQ